MSSTNWIEADHDIIGPDVSHYQGSVNWTLMAQTHANMGFAMCKASQSNPDVKLQDNLNAMKQQLSTVNRTFGHWTHPIAIGTYHFSNISADKTETDYVAQADFYYQTVINTNVVPNFWVLDWEDPAGKDIPPTIRAKCAKAFVVRLYNNLKNTFGASYVPKIFIYVGSYYWGTPDVDVVGNPYEWFVSDGVNSHGPKLWIARYLKDANGNIMYGNVLPPEQYHYDDAEQDPKLNIPHFASGNNTWHAWQFTQTAHMQGVAGFCDISVVRNSDVWHSDFYQSGTGNDPHVWPTGASPIKHGMTVENVLSLSTLHADLIENAPDSLIDMPTIPPMSSYDRFIATELNKMSNLAYDMYDYHKTHGNDLSSWTLPVSSPRFPSSTPARYMYEVNHKNAPPIGFIIESAMNADGVTDVYFVWRGTVDKGEWMDDTKFFPVNFLGAKVHKGFHQIYTKRASSNVGPTPHEVVINYMQNILTRPSQNKYRLCCTGHSLGGALALLSSYEMMKILDTAGNPSNIEVMLYNFASPKVGNTTFVNYFNNKTLSPSQGPTSWRVTNVNDFVPKIPPGYSHINGHHQIEFGLELSTFHNNRIVVNHDRNNYLKELLTNLSSTGTTKQELLQRNIQYTADELTAGGF